jgi:Txe/YoeB family toxin of Txe-Axe toxin-antitoxin module
MKSDRVIFVDKNLEDSFNVLSNKDPLKKALVKAIKNIQKNAFCGRNVKKNLIPKKFVSKYKLKNLWIYNLPSSWRLLYSITPGEDVKIIAAVLDWMSHKDYDRLFRFT